ncbi:hypothetical protein R50072_31260 [Simiduia litorea]|uniref:hypothetical protein n=1 Tax=Simiduia litorea TaxID=1435348 RepID=UPI0036F2AD21
MLNKIRSLLIVFCLLSLSISGCITSTPEKDSKTVEESASISFKISESALHTPIEIYIDGKHMGSAQEFQTSIARLKVITGTHILELKSNKETIKKEKFFVSKGSNKEFSIEAI